MSSPACCSCHSSEVSPNDQTVDTSNQSILDISMQDINSSKDGGIQESKFKPATDAKIFKPTKNFQPSLKPNAAIP